LGPALVAQILAAVGGHVALLDRVRARDLIAVAAAAFELAQAAQALAAVVADRASGRDAGRDAADHPCAGADGARVAVGVGRAPVVAGAALEAAVLAGAVGLVHAAVPAAARKLAAKARVDALWIETLDGLDAVDEPVLAAHEAARCFGAGLHDRLGVVADVGLGGLAVAVAGRIAAAGRIAVGCRIPAARWHRHRGRAAAGRSVPRP